MTNLHIHTYTPMHIHIHVITQIHKHLPAGIVKEDTINHVASVGDKVKKLSVYKREGRFHAVHLSALKRTPAQQSWMFKLISLWPLEVIC